MKGREARIDAVLLLLRIGLGLVMTFYGCQKMFGIFGGPGYAKTIEFMTTGMSIPPVFAHLAIAAEFFGGLGVLLGCLTHIAAFGVACTMAVVVFLNGRKDNLFSGIFNGSKAMESHEVFYPFVLLVMALAIMITGAGQFSLDARLFRGRK